MVLKSKTVFTSFSAAVGADDSSGTEARSCETVPPSIDGSFVEAGSPFSVALPDKFEVDFAKDLTTLASRKTRRTLMRIPSKEYDGGRVLGFSGTDVICATSVTDTVRGEIHTHVVYPKDV